MLTKSQPQTTIQPDEKMRKIEIGPLKLNKETVKELTTGERKLIRGGNAKCHSTYIIGGGGKDDRGDTLT